MADVLMAIVIGAGVVTATINVLRDPLDPSHKWPNSLIDGIALVIGVGYALGWGANFLPALIALAPKAAPFAEHADGVAGQVLSGLTFGAAATFGAKLFNAIGAWQNKNQRTVGE